MAGMFSTMFSGAEGAVQGAEDQVGGAGDHVMTGGEQAASEMDQRGEQAMDRGEAAAGHAGNDVSSTADVGAHMDVTVQLRVHQETSYDYRDGDGTGHEGSRSSDFDTGETHLGQDLELGSTIDSATESMFDTM